MSDTIERLYKFLDPGGLGPYSGYRWPLPTQAGDGAWTPGDWVTVEGPLDPCRVGLHACREADTTLWIAAECYALEYRGERMDAPDKVVVRQARLTRRYTAWDKRAMRLFAADCAERVLPRYEAAYPGDARPRVAIETARRFARGAATGDELAAAGAAAEAAAKSAAWAAAWAATGAAAKSAAEAAAWAAAWAAAGAAAGAAECAWQTDRLAWYLTQEAI